MNLQEFAALKVGDQIENPMSNSQGTVTSTSDSGVHVSWLSGGTHETPTFFYSVQGTAWMHWSKAESGNNSEQPNSNRVPK